MKKPLKRGLLDEAPNVTSQSIFISRKAYVHKKETPGLRPLDHAQKVQDLV